MTVNNMDTYALYLRKSRADLDAEARGEGETLAKHRAALTAYAKQRGLFIVREYAELVSGDTIAARPQMQALLEDVKAGMYAGVIVNDVDRLGRGDSIDQEIIKLTFAAAHCIIITPGRDIDPANPTDDDMLDFSMFLARFEYKKISQRMAQGRIRSAAAGNWIAGSPPFGYRVIKNGISTTLQPDEDTAPIVRMIFEWYASGEFGYFAIAARLADMGIQFTPGHLPRPASIKKILTNPVYIGRLEYGKRTTISVIEDGKRVKKRVRRQAPLSIDNTFPALIDVQMWEAAQERITLSRHRSPVNANAIMQNPLSGIVVCSRCGRAMCRQQGHGRPLLACINPGCTTSATYLDTVENALLEILESWCAEYQDQEAPPPDTHEEERKALQKQIDTLRTQITRAQELVELNVYAPSEYIARKTALEAQISAVQANMDKLSRPTPQAAKAAILPRLRSVLDAYQHAQTPEDKNRLLRSVVDKVIYYKDDSARGNKSKPGDMLQLQIFPRLV